MIDINKPLEVYLGSFNTLYEIYSKSTEWHTAGYQEGLRVEESECDCCGRQQYAVYGKREPPEQLKEWRRLENEASRQAQRIIESLRRGEGKRTKNETPNQV